MSEHDEQVSLFEWAASDMGGRDRMSEQTAHERYEEQVKNGIWRPYDDAQMAAKQRQVDGLVAERDALAVVVAAKTEQVAGLVEERDSLRDWIIEASSAWRDDGGTDTLAEALGLVRMCHEGAAALAENAELRAKLMAARDTADKWQRAVIGEIPGEITTTLVCDTCKKEFAGRFNSQAWYVCHICGSDLWHKKQSPAGETLDGGSNELLG